ncbi:MAG: carbohydrate kinase family protein [Candidatus Moranbacteria bacterium]|nr:carbohydrate kinase family protein [Candidatus Moranbacteria bacterium]
MENENKLDILTIGDIATEPFIRIKEAEIEPEKGSKEDFNLCLDYGGKIPYESAVICPAVGNSSNVAISTSRLGLRSSLMSYVGNDEVGQKDIDKLKEENVDTNYIKVIDGMDSNYHYVLWYKSERTILVRHTDFPYSLPKIEATPKWIYLSSLSINSISYHQEILNYLNENKEIKFAIQPGTFQIRLGVDKLKGIYERADIYFSNKEEAEKILNKEDSDVKSLLKEIYVLGPKIVIITDGIRGSYCFDGKEFLYMESLYEESKTIENTGAGDAFSSAFISALVYGKNIKEALVWGTINASSVVQFVGPHKGLMRKEEIERKEKEIKIVPQVLI